ncbi:hypothetical protein [Halorubrum vacuolatum]|uniref:DUF7988 domain-containing protein n=1 Tax=Halorubrum vacuolatum TaxID=63740 RepID=A0A238X2G9_HALVU|nr:hypothetical protein [Halorubrum vacuolatum]SNR52758.1 hypothetical protein SAMN06264855_11265 [Halorubrum vacuolatum]
MTGSDLDAAAARRRLLGTHRETVMEVLACGEAVAEGFETTVGGDPATRESRVLRTDLRTVLDRAGLLEALATLLPDLVAAAGGRLRATPVAAPPYVAVTATGPVLRATLTEARLVIRIETYDVVDGAFCWRDPTPEEAVFVRLR